MTWFEILTMCGLLQSRQDFESLIVGFMITSFKFHFKNHPCRKRFRRPLIATLESLNQVAQVNQLNYVLRVDPALFLSFFFYIIIFSIHVGCQ